MKTFDVLLTHIDGMQISKENTYYYESGTEAIEIDNTLSHVIHYKNGEIKKIKDVITMFEILNRLIEERHCMDCKCLLYEDEEIDFKLCDSCRLERV